MPRELQPCGTRAAYQRHKYHYEPIDKLCWEASQKYEDARTEARGGSHHRDIVRSPCGTVKAALQHRYHKESLCDLCTEAMRAYNRASAERKRRQKGIPTQEQRSTIQKSKTLPCGTAGALNRHKLAGERCEICRAADNKRARERYANRTPEEILQKRSYSAEWAKIHADSKNESAAKRRYRKRQEAGENPNWTRKEILVRDNYICYLCGKKVDLTAPHVSGTPGWELYPHMEHVIPLSRGGSNDISNVKTACAKCNLAKNNKLLEEYLAIRQ